MKVLLVDDDQDQITIRSLLLERHGFVTAFAGDRVSALQLAEAQKPHCAIVDLRLPTEEAGLRLIRELKELDANIRIIVLTGANPRCLDTQPEARLVDRVLLKPSSSALLIEHLKMLAFELSG
ncbi:MAG TPA: response regulator [Bryobacteraceae bacterium]|nr:response regulator [Bryobacteraceae bacterium]